MQQFKGLEELVGRLSDAVPDSVKHIQADFENNLRTGLESGLQKMNLVTREEFETQSAVLQKTREKVEQLEQTIIELEKRLADSQDGND